MQVVFKIFRIGEFARLNKVTIKTLRYYDEIGILTPDKIDKMTGYRYYSANQIMKLNKIIRLKYMGFSLDEISYVMLKDMSAEGIKDILSLKRMEIEKKISEESERLSRIEAFIKTCEMEEYNMKYDVILKKIDSVRVASLRDYIPNYSEQGHLWEELGKHIECHGARIVPPCMVIYHDTGYKEDNVDAEVIEPIEGELPETERIKVRDLEGVDSMATVIHNGSYETLHIAFSEISKWIESNKYEITGPHRELYLKGEWNSSSPNEYVTEIQFPVKKK